MITITQDDGVVRLINVFSCEPKNQQHLIAAWIRATEETLGKLPGIISATLHRSEDGRRVVNYAKSKSSEHWENLLQIGSKAWFSEMGKYAKPDPRLYEACYLLDKTESARGDL
jgi:hypothetical protein